jgi:zinc transporter ZupT
MTAWYFLDIMAASTFLGINQGLTSATLLLVLLFLLGFLFTIMLEPYSKSNKLYDPIFLAAGVIGLHGIGEGIAIGSILTSATDPIAAVGGPLSAVSFVIHKGLEAFIVSALAVSAGKYYSHIWAAVLIVGVPTILGAIAGYVFAPNDTIFFALGAGGTLWLLSTLFAKSMTLTSRFKWSMALVAGVMLMFVAGILHSIR